MMQFMVDLDDRSYPIIIEPSGLNHIGRSIREHHCSKRVVVITDETVMKLYGKRVQSALQQASIRSTTHVVPDGESSKSIEQVSNLYTELIETNLHRDALVIALGGGVVGDLAGFVAATYLRGIDFIQIPTTLLAQVDSSVGGKVGINHPLGKNLIGSFYQPRLVYIDPKVLTTLDRREMWAGLGEVVKYGLIWDNLFWTFMELHLKEISELKDWDIISQMIDTCCRIKAEVVKKDEKESGLRRILNFGHTLGHALEVVTDYQYFKHGEAIVHGMRFAAWLSWQKAHLSKADFERIEALLKQFEIPELPKNIDSQTLFEKTRIDKKQTREGLQFVCLDQIGRTKVEPVPDLSNQISGWLDYVRK
ncbi:3-dehydroquinate synthase [bacterium]|nr:3-dehydroquinate synthase [bacterium]RQV95532.1 MAG: 3-dehydroquinate synthase [bacterium]